MIGVLVPLLAFLLVAWLGVSSALAWMGPAIWGVVAFTGVLMMAFRRTRRIGVGILLGFSGLLVAGAGTCTAVVIGQGA